MRNTVLACLGAIAIACGGGSGGGGDGGGGGGGGGWTKYAGFVLAGSPGTWDAGFVGSPCVIQDAGVFKMWYDGSVSGAVWSVGLATSADGTAWTKSASNPVLSSGPAGAWDEEAIGMTSVLFDGTTYRMWYYGTNAAGLGRIGYATSPDGVTWTKHAANPVLTVGPAGSWDASSVGGPSVIRDGGIYKMWYTGAAGAGPRIGYATSPDGVTWSKHASNPVLGPGPAGSWDADGPEGCGVILDAGTYRMWYGGNRGADERIGYAGSPDGIAWTKDAGNPVIGPGAPGSWDENDVWTPSVVKDGSVLRLWYMADTSGGVSRIGTATSP